MKKALSLILALMLCLSICACKNSGSPATITDLTEKEVQLTAKELCSLCEENSVNFFELYGGASIKAVGTVSEVNRSYEEPEYWAHIVMEEGWELVVMVKDHDEVANIVKGDKISFTSKIQTCGSDRVILRHSMIDVDGEIDCSTIEVIE